MRELLNQDRALSAATIRLAISVLGLLLTAATLIIIAYGTITIFAHGSFWIGLLQICAGVGLLLGFYLIVRLQAETLIAAHRTNDRLMILSDALSPRQSDLPERHKKLAAEIKSLAGKKSLPVSDSEET